MKEKLNIKTVAVLKLCIDNKDKTKLPLMKDETLEVSDYLAFDEMFIEQEKKDLSTIPCVRDFIKISSINEEDAKNKTMFLLPEHGIIRDIAAEAKNRYNLTITRDYKKADFLVINEKLYNGPLINLSETRSIFYEIPKQDILDLLSFDSVSFYNKCLEYDIFSERFEPVIGKKYAESFYKTRDGQYGQLAFFDKFSFMFYRIRPYYASAEIVQADNIRNDFKNVLDSFFRSDILNKMKSIIEKLDHDYICISGGENLVSYFGYLKALKEQESILSTCKTLTEVKKKAFHLFPDSLEYWFFKQYKSFKIFDNKFDYLFFGDDDKEVILQTNINSLIKKAGINEEDFLMLSRLFSSPDKSNIEMATNLLLNYSVEDNLPLLALLITENRHKITESRISKTASFKKFADHFSTAVERHLAGIEYSKKSRLRTRLPEIIKNAKSYFIKTEYYLADLYNLSKIFYKNKEEIPKFFIDHINKVITDVATKPLEQHGILDICDVNITLK